MEENKEAYQFYWCGNCGFHGDYGKQRKTRLFCRDCNYDDVTHFTETEIQEHEDLKTRDFKRK